MIDLGAMLQWWNFMFLLPLVSGLVLALGVALVGAGLDGGAEDGTGDGTGDGVGKGEGGLLQLLGFFGFGRGLPLSVLLPILLVAWGAAGLLLNGVLSPFLPPLLFAPLSAVAGFALAALAGRSLGAGFVRLFLGGETATRTGGLVGCWGTAVFTVGKDEGTANVRDPFGNIHRVACRSEGARAIAPGEALVVTGFDDTSRVYLVAPAEGERALPESAARERG